MANDFTHVSLVKAPNKTLNNRVQNFGVGEHITVLGRQWARGVPELCTASTPHVPVHLLHVAVPELDPVQ